MKRLIRLITVVSVVLLAVSAFATEVYVPASLNAKKGDSMLTGSNTGMIGGCLGSFGAYWSHSMMMIDDGETLRHNTMNEMDIPQIKDACGVPKMLEPFGLENGVPGILNESMEDNNPGATNVILCPTAATEAASRPTLEDVGDDMIFMDMYYRIHAYIDMVGQENYSSTRVAGEGSHCSGTITFANINSGVNMAVGYITAAQVNVAAYALYDGLYAIVLEEVNAQAGCLSGVVDAEGCSADISNQVANGFGLDVYNDTNNTWESYMDQVDSYANAPDHLLMQGYVNPASNAIGVQTSSTSLYNDVKAAVKTAGYYTTI